MTHKDSGHFAGKHPEGTTVAPEISQAVQKRIDNGRISCADAHAIAKSLNVSPRLVGIAIDLQEARIQKCLLGLFGHGKGRKAVQPAESVSTELAEVIEAEMVHDRLPCEAAWRIAKEKTLSRTTVANACEKLGIRIKPCQLGAF